MKNLLRIKYFSKKRNKIQIGSILGSTTGERDRDPVSGGWEGSDDANSTAPSDLSQINDSPTGRVEAPDIQKFADDLGNVSDMETIDFPGVRNPLGRGRD